jgi:hypothetical protein
MSKDWRHYLPVVKSIVSVLRNAGRRKGFGVVNSLVPSFVMQDGEKNLGIAEDSRKFAPRGIKVKFPF